LLTARGSKCRFRRRECGGLDISQQSRAASSVALGLAAPGGFFKPVPETRRSPLFRFCLMVIRRDTDPALRRKSTTWSALRGERVLALTPGHVVQDFIDSHLAKAKIHLQPFATFNYLDTLTTIVKAGEGIAIVPSFVLPACRNRKVAISKLINQVVNLDFSRRVRYIRQFRQYEAYSCCSPTVDGPSAT
jgi:LysR family transcriptional regulator, carnitine catabolism transcriptional activator